MVAVGCALLLILLLGTAAAAHGVGEGLGSFQGGLLHPFLTPAHALALVALGLSISQRQRRHRNALVMLFAIALFGALGAIMAAFVFTDGTNLLLVTAILTGLLTASARPLRFWVMALLLLAVAVGTVFDSVPQEIRPEPTLISLAGTIIGAWLIVTAIGTSVAEPRREWMRIGIRILGSWSAASALLVLALRLTR
jgi:urease accessory protein